MTRHMTSAPLRSSTAEHVYRASTLAEARTSLSALPRTKAPKAFTSMDLGAPRKKRSMGPMGMRGGGVVDRGLSDELGEVMRAAGCGSRPAPSRSGRWNASLASRRRW